jgi:hypothetical protein
LVKNAGGAMSENFPPRTGGEAVHELRRGASPPIIQAPPQVSFDRRELRIILNLYGRMVAAGEWRDYALDFLPDRAVFSIFRRASEIAMFRIEKTPALARRQGAWSVTAASGLVMKRGHELARVLAVLEKRPALNIV